MINTYAAGTLILACTSAHDRPESIELRTTLKSVAMRCKSASKACCNCALRRNCSHGYSGSDHCACTLLSNVRTHARFASVVLLLREALFHLSSACHCLLLCNLLCLTTLPIDASIFTLHTVATAQSVSTCYLLFHFYFSPRKPGPLTASFLTTDKICPSYFACSNFVYRKRTRE